MSLKQVAIAADSGDKKHSYLPREFKWTPGAAYAHLTTNNTIEGTEYRTLPDVGDVPLVSDNSSDIFSGPIDIARHALIYAGAQKNIGPAGVTLVLIREDLLVSLQRCVVVFLDATAHVPTLRRTEPIGRPFCTVRSPSVSGAVQSQTTAALRPRVIRAS